jgi:hypothetical protein
MRGIVYRSAVMMLLCVATTAHAQPISEPDVSLDRTAFFVGEPIRYQVTVRHDPTVEFVLDRLDKASLQLAPFNVTDVVVETRQSGSRRLLAVTLHLVTFEIVQKEWKIPSFNLYYVARDATAPGEGRPVQRLEIPATPVAFRSALPDESNRIRTQVLFDDFTIPFWTLLSIGAVGVVMVGSRVALLAYQQMRRKGPEGEARSAIDRKTRHAVEQLLSQNEEGGNGRTPAFYLQMAALLREYSGKVADTTGAALTAAEVRDTLVRAGEDPERARRIAQLVSVADLIRYTDEGEPLARERWDETRRELQDLFE